MPNSRVQRALEFHTFSKKGVPVCEFEFGKFRLSLVIEFALRKIGCWPKYHGDIHSRLCRPVHWRDYWIWKHVHYREWRRFESNLFIDLPEGGYSNIFSSIYSTLNKLPLNIQSKMRRLLERGMLHKTNTCLSYAVLLASTAATNQQFSSYKKLAKIDNENQVHTLVEDDGRRRAARSNFRATSRRITRRVMRCAHGQLLDKKEGKQFRGVSSLPIRATSIAIELMAAGSASNKKAFFTLWFGQFLSILATDNTKYVMLLSHAHTPNTGPSPSKIVIVILHQICSSSVWLKCLKIGCFQTCTYLV